MATLSLVVSLGGVSALSWETIWQIQATLAFGASAPGAAITLAVTMGGIALGSLVAGHWLSRADLEQPLRAYALLEWVIGGTAALSLSGFGVLASLDAWIYGVWSPAADLLHALGMAALILPPTLAMGATIPLFQLIARREGQRISILYGMNTAGAALGVLLMAFVLLPALGVVLTSGIAASVNVLAGAMAWLLSSRGGSADTNPLEAATQRPETRLALNRRLALIATFSTGFVTFGLEVVWFRALRSALWSTSSTFAIMLASVLVALAVGARIVPWLRSKQATPDLLLAGSGFLVLAATPIVERFDLLAVSSLGSSGGPVAWFGATLLTLGPGVVLLATVLPWLLEDNPEPQVSGRLYAANAIGSVLGSITAGWILLPTLGFAGGAWLLASILILLAFVAAEATRRRGWIAAIGVWSVAVAMSMSSSPGRDRMYAQPELETLEIVAFDESADFTVSVVGTRRARTLLIDGFGATGEGFTTGHYMLAMGALPAMLHSSPENSLVICFGTGQTANALRRASLGRVDIVDISDAVFGMAEHFSANQGVLDDPRVEAIEMDGRAWLRRTQRSYDVITLEPMPPNFSGVNALYSREFYEIAAERLAEDGVIAQWVPFHLLSIAHARAITATFLETFPDAILWTDPVDGTGILLGRKRQADAPLGDRWPGMERGLRTMGISADEVRKGVLLTPSQLVDYAAGSVVTDDNRMLEYSELSRSAASTLMLRNTKRNREELIRAAGRPLYIRP
ncbi:MAG: fused MFS/spermidine synthase [Myxococcota bacterium]|nr:fused MFS/spermidine synthase [Myxococcota bacterium]